MLPQSSSLPELIRGGLGLVAVLCCLLRLGAFAGGEAPGGQTNVSTYEVKGIFLESRSEGRVAIIAHEPVPGYMDAMTMPFNVKSPQEIRKLKSGDQISFRLSVTDSDDWIDHIEKSKKARRQPTQASVSAPAVPELAVGAPVPDFVLTNQFGKVIRPGDFKGQTLALTFFFSRCPLPTFCPRMSNNFEAAQQDLAKDLSRTNWQLLSISFDPAADTRDRLTEFAALHHAVQNHWTFATSNQEEVRKLGAAFGLKFWRESGSFSHNLRTVVVAPSGRIQKILPGNEWRAADLVAEMQKAMGINGTGE